MRTIIVVLVSSSHDGLQNCLIRLEAFCARWGLSVNLKKTKIMIFNPQGRIIKANFTYMGGYVEQVREYDYLGIRLSTCGSYAAAHSHLYNKGLNAYFKLIRTFSVGDPPIRTCLHIFDHTVKPVLLYGSEIWGSVSTNSKMLQKDRDFKIEAMYTNSAAEKLNHKLCSFLLNVSIQKQPKMQYLEN